MVADNSTPRIEVLPFFPPMAAEVTRLILQIQRDEFGLDVSIDDQPDLREISHAYQGSGGNFWVAMLDGKLVGTIGLFDIGRGNAALRKMFVAPAARGKRTRAAATLLETLIDWAATNEFRTVFLGTTDRFRAAHRFYEKNGFIEVARGDLPVEFPLMRVDTKFYRRSITNL